MIDGSNDIFQKGDLLVVSNSYTLKIRTDKVVSDILNLTRSAVKALKELDVIIVKEEKLEHKIIIKIEGDIHGQIDI